MSEVFKTFNKDDIQIRDFTARKYYTLKSVISQFPLSEIVIS